MKKLLTLLVAAVTVCALAACSQTPPEPAQPQTTEIQEQAAAQPSETANDATPEPTPEPKRYAPMDIFGSEFNPFGMDSPFTVFSASFQKGSAKLGGNARFVLSMTGGGNMFACIAYLADVSGLGLDESGKFALLEEYRANGYFCEFTGEDGRVVTVRQADPNDDRYEYVEADGQHDFHGGGCVIDITFFINDADLEKYTKLVSDNYNLEALAPLSDYMDIETDFSVCGFGVNLHKQQAASFVDYYPPDAAAIQKSMESGLSSDWWEWNGMKETSIQYGALDSKLTFNFEANAITIEQTNNNFSSLASGQAESEVSLTRLGFGFDEAGTCGVFELREPHYVSVAIHRPEWGEFDGDWNMEYMDTDVNGYSLRITYHASEGRYHVSLEKDGIGCAYETYPDKNQVGGEYPDLDTVQRMFNAALGTREKELYAKPLENFEQLVREHFGMSLAELYALPIQ